MNGCGMGRDGFVTVPLSNEKGVNSSIEFNRNVGGARVDVDG